MSEPTDWRYELAALVVMVVFVLALCWIGGA